MKAPTPKRRILVVDDDVAHARSLVDLLSRAGHEVSATHTAQDAIGAVVASVPDLALVDVRPPGDSGPIWGKALHSQYGVAIHTALARSEELRELRRREAQLSEALQQTRAVSAATGVVMERLRLSRDQAFRTPVVRHSVSIGSGLTNLAFVQGPAAPTLRHSTADPTRPTSLGPASRPPSSNNASFAKPFRGCACGHMETQRLRAIQHPNHASTLLESWASSQDIIPVRARRIRAASELSRPLRCLVRRSNSDESAWCSWTDGHRIWFVAAAPSLELACERKKPCCRSKSTMSAAR